jgi:hypothetical protein
MKLKTALTTLFLFLLSFLFVDITSAEFFYPPSTSSDVVVSASINIDLYSQLSLFPSTVEVGQPSTVSITTLLPDGSPRIGREILIYIDGDSENVTIVQPSLTDSEGEAVGFVDSLAPGTYKICAKDVTEGLEIFIADCAILYVIPVPAPQMLSEPEYTKGDSNTVMWNMVGTGVYEYYVEVSTTSDFSDLLDNSGWITNLAYEFDNLDDGQIYFYRVKAKNSYGVEGGWSNVVFSVQDDEGPEIEFIDISGMDENTNVNWDRDYEIHIRYRIVDNVDIASKDFWCIGSDGSRYDCLYTATERGDFWDITIQLKYLEKTESGNLFEEYKFCVEATDSVNNVSRNCEAKLEIEIEVPEEEIPKPTIPPLITKIIDRLDKIFDETFLKLKQAPLDNITVTTTAINLTIGFGFLVATFGSIPYALFQLFLSILTLLGFRKKSNVSGYVYNSLTKEPIRQAVVRVFNEVHELIWTSVTDSNGYFMAPEVKDGEYYITVTARDYTFPSKIVFGKKDFPLENVYHGDPFLTKDEEIPNFSIPMDPVDVKPLRTRLAKIFSSSKLIWQIILILLFIFGLLLSIFALFVTRIWWNYIMVALYVPSLFSLFFNIFAKRNKFGVVRDTDKKPVDGAIVGLKEKDFGKLVSKRVTDGLGRYKFLVDRGIYEMSILNSDLKVVDGEELDNIEIEKKGGQILAPNIIVKRLEDEVEEDELIEALEEL